MSPPSWGKVQAGDESFDGPGRSGVWSNRLRGRSVVLVTVEGMKGSEPGSRS